MKRDQLLSASEFERVFAEVEILKQLDHPNIVKIFEMYQDDKRFYIVTELCTGGEVFDEILWLSQQKKHFSERTASVIVK